MSWLRITVPSPEFRATAYYFTMYMSAGAGVTYASIWMLGKGISEEQIGIINALPVLVILGLNLLVGRIADRARDWRSVIVIGSLLGGIVPIAFFFVNEFWGILLVWTLAALPGGAIGPVVDAATMRMTRRNGTDYGRIRAWGTVGYMLFNALTGLLAMWLGPGVFVPLLVGLGLLRAVASLQLPRFRAPEHQPSLADVKPTAGRMRAVMKPWFLLPLVGSSMVFSTHLVINTFGAPLWQAQGISEGIIGPMIALGAFAEAMMFFVWKRFSGRLSARNMMLVSALVAAARWTAMAFSPPVAVLIALQLLHSVTFALGFLSAVHFIANWTSEDIAAEAQSFLTVLQQATSVLALVAFGWLVAHLGAHAYLVAALMALVGAGCIWLSLRMVQPKG